MKEYSFTVTSGETGLRIDKALAQLLKAQYSGVSRTAIKDAIEAGQVSRGRKEVRSAHEKVQEGEILSIRIKERKEPSLAPEDISLEVVYEDDDLAVINKPSGLVVHPAPGNYEHTLVNALLGRFRSLSDINPQRPGIVHRLDKETSGLLVVARNNAAHLELARQFAKHTISRFYVAVVIGRVEFDEDIIEAPIGRHPVRRKSMAVSFQESAKSARTHYRTIKRGSACSLLELKPHTGRTHQLRVHCAFIGHPILGDAKYGGTRPVKGFGLFPATVKGSLAHTRLMLHARSLGFIHPRTGEKVEFSTGIPPEFLETDFNPPG
ncbi:MAG: RluA family pseudouridine synthase [Candidatus Omnitrophica bacterium]|nr:RluA family pseudouridine synthase [Candidatus Omnitrophota bacterium]